MFDLDEIELKQEELEIIRNLITKIENIIYTEMNSRLSLNCNNGRIKVFEFNIKSNYSEELKIDINTCCFLPSDSNKLVGIKIKLKDPNYDVSHV